MKNKKFVTLYETIYNRYKQGAGFLEGDVVKLKSNYKSADSYKNMSETIKVRMEDAAKSGYNLRVGKLHTPNQQYGSFGTISLPATHADIYQEMSPGNFGNLFTVPIDLIEEIDTGVNLPPVSKNNKRTPKEAPYQDGTEDPGENKDPITDEQTDTAKKQTRVKKGDYELAKKDKKGSVGANSYDDSKPSNFKPLPKNKKITKESVDALESAYFQVLTENTDIEYPEVEDPEPHMPGYTLPEDEVPDSASNTEIDDYMLANEPAVNAYEDVHGPEGIDQLFASDLETVKAKLAPYGTAAEDSHQSEEMLEDLEPGQATGGVVQAPEENEQTSAL